MRRQKPNAPVGIFVHGGAWRSGAASGIHLLAEPFVHPGAHFVVLDFINVDQAGGSLFPMVEQVRRAVGWVYRNADKFGGDRNRLHLVSHSSGSHLAGCTVTHDWAKDGLAARHPQGRGALERHVRSQAGAAVEAVQIRQIHRRDGAGAESPMRHLDRLHTPLILTYGTCETPEFQRQSRDFAAAVKAAGKPVELLVGEGYNHFEMLETLANPYGLLGRARAEADAVDRRIRPRRTCASRPRSIRGPWSGSVRRRSAGRHRWCLQRRRAIGRRP